MSVRLSELLGKPVIMAEDVVGPDAQAKAAALKPGEIMLLENTRFEPGETKNDPELAKAMASMAEVYVSDAFGAVHRAHASTAGVAAYLPAVSGFLIQKELEVMGGALANPKRPLVAILGGSKVSSKIGVINNLLNIADTIIIGGGMSYTFAKAQGAKIGKSLLEEDWIQYAGEMVEKAKEKGVKLLLPVDGLAATEFSADAEAHLVDGVDLLVHGEVGLVVVLAALGVADDHVLGSGFLDHLGGDLAGVGAVVLIVAGLRADGDVAVLEQTHGGGDVHRGDAQDYIAPLAPGHDGLELLGKGLHLGQGVVHLPVAGDDSLTITTVHWYFSPFFLFTSQAPAFVWRSRI